MSFNGYLTIAPRNGFSATNMKCLGVALFTLIQFNVKGGGGSGLSLSKKGFQARS